MPATGADRGAGVAQLQVTAPDVRRDDLHPWTGLFRRALMRKSRTCLTGVTKRFKRTKKEFLESAIRREAAAAESEIERRLEVVRRTAGILSPERADEIMREIQEARAREGERRRELWEGDIPE